MDGDLPFFIDQMKGLSYPFMILVPKPTPNSLRMRQAPFLAGCQVWVQAPSFLLPLDVGLEASDETLETMFLENLGILLDCAVTAHARSTAQAEREKEREREKMKTN